MATDNPQTTSLRSRLDYAFRHNGIYFLLHLAVLVLSVYLIVDISIDAFKNVNSLNQPRFLRTQFWICIVFLADFFIELLLTPKKGHYLATHIIFFLVSIPYLAIFAHYHLTFSSEVTYLLRYIPLVRGGYALAIVVGWFTYNRATGLFVTYLITLLASVYFASLLFFIFEHGVNPPVKHYEDALWWACMDFTTVGSNIIAVTPVGRVLSVMLAALGMMMLPIFTVYVTSIITRQHNTSAPLINIPSTTPEDDAQNPPQIQKK